MFNISIIGYGMSAKVFHEQLIRCCDTLQLRGVVSSQATQYLPPDIIHYRSVDEMLDDDNIDIVVNATPTSQHFSLSKAVLKAKKHLIIEKPMVTTVDEGLELIQLAQQHSKLLSVYHNRRLAGDFKTVKQLINSNKLGEIYHTEIHFDRFRPLVQNRWREQAGCGSGILYDLGSHLIDQALQLFGFPQAVTARCLALRPNSPSIDYFHLQLHYANHEVILHSSPYHNAPNPTFRLEGRLGTFVKYGLDPQEEQLKSGMIPTDVGFGEEAESNYGIYYDEQGKENRVTIMSGSYLDFYRNFSAAVAGEAPLMVSPEQALDVIKIIEIAEQSSKSKKTITGTKVIYPKHLM